MSRVNKSGDSPSRMQCLTVWGGNSSTSRVFDVPGLRIWVHSRVYGNAERGGDVYYLSSCASGRITRLLVADVSGHGTAASQTAESLRKMMQANVNHIRQERVVRSVNQEFTERNDSDGFATALVSTFFSPTRSLTLSNAGHPPPLLYRHKNRRWQIYEPKSQEGQKGANLPLGVVPETRFDESQFRLENGDMLLLYTDAFFEARNAENQMLAANGLRELLQSIDPQDPDAIIPALIDAVEKLRPGNLDGDDATAVLIRATGSKTPIWNTLLSPFRFLGTLLGLRKVHTVAPAEG